jgi:hypothetical protein
MTETHADRVVFGFHAALTAAVFLFMGMQLAV